MFGILLGPVNLMFNDKLVNLYSDFVYFSGRDNCSSGRVNKVYYILRPGEISTSPSGSRVHSGQFTRQP